MEYIDPTQQEYTDAEQLALDVLETSSPALMTKVGSVIRELVIRPIAYLYSWVSSNMSEMRHKASMAYLSTSQATENPVADEVASNYFVTRQQGRQSEGTVTLTITTPMLQLPIGSGFTIGGVSASTPIKVMAIDTTTSGIENNILYTPLIPYDGNYLVNVPVRANDTGAIEIAAGAEVEINFGITGIIDAQLTSALTGGSGTETDAELMQRAKYNTAESGIGTYYGLKKKMAGSPVHVVDIGVMAGEDEPMYRARYNTLNISPGGFVDCFVKTQPQPSIGVIRSAASYIGDEAHGVTTYHRWQTTLSSTDCAGWFGITRLIAGSGDSGRQIDNYTVTFSSGSAYNNGPGARLGQDQVETVIFLTQAASDESTNDLPITAYVSYMPGVYAIQKFMDSSLNTYIGQDVQIKAAVPVALSLDCVARYTGAGDVPNDIVENVRTAITSYINGTRVGAGELNFSDIRDAVAASVPDVELRLPCSMSAIMLTKDGYAEAFYSTAGVLDIRHPARQDYWSSDICYFCIVPDNVRVDYI